MPRNLADKTIIITGASSGIGAATAVECARHGMNVVLNARREDRLREMQSRIDKLGRKAAIVAGDVTEPGMSERTLDAADQAFGGFYAVFANAGYGTNKAIHLMSDQETRQMFEVNFFAGVDLLNKATIRLIERKQPGHLLMCSSCLAKFSMPLHGCYAATKAAQCQVCWAMRGELKPYNINVSSVLPITTTTEFFEVSAKKSGERSAAKVKPDDVPRFMMQSPEKVARAIVRCLKRPRPEVWTSPFMRTLAGLMTMCPPLASLVMRSQKRQVDRAIEKA
jgi:short-subunit dehydrogenase